MQPQALPAGWESAVDPTTGHTYYFNRSTGRTSWVAPETIAGPSDVETLSVAPEASTVDSHAHSAGANDQPIGQPATAAPLHGSTTFISGEDRQASEYAASGSGRPVGSGPAAAGGSRNGWYYRDRSGTLHGPFQQAALRAWRSFLPMDLLVWYVELQPGQGQGPQQAQSAAASQQGTAAASSRQAAGGETPQGPGQSRKRPHEELTDGDGGGGEVNVEANGGGSQPDGNAADGGEEAGAGALAAQRGAAAVSLGLDAYADGHDEGAEAGVAPSDGGGVAAAGREGDADATAKSGAEVGQEHGDGGGGADAANRTPSPKRPRVGSPSPSGATAAAGASATASVGRRSASLSPAPDAGDGEAAAVGADAEAGADGPAARKAGPASAEEAIACGLPGIELAELLGDGSVLADWRQRFPGSRPPGSAPPAPVHDHWLRATAASLAAAHHAAAYAHGAQYGHGYGYANGHGYAHGYGQGSAAAQESDGVAASRPRSREESMREYAEAVLAGLPPDDEAVVLARHAAAAGRSITEVVNFSWSASTGAGALATVAGYGDGGEAAAAAAAAAVDEHGVPTEYVRDPRSGRLTAVGKDAAPATVAKALYGEYGNWVNPDQIEDYLAKAKLWRQQQLPLLWSRKKQKEQREAKAKKAIKALLE